MTSVSASEGAGAGGEEGLRIVVCIKQVGVMLQAAALDLATGRPDPDRMVFMLNPDDEVAVEAALRIRERCPGGEVTLLTVGPAAAEPALRYAFAMGGRRVDRMIRIDGEPPDAWSAARLLAAMIATQGFDLVLCGRRAIDTHGGQLGSFIAELLDAPQVSGIVKLTLLKDGRKAIVERNLGKGDREEVECRLPALFTVDPGLNEPRYPTCPDRMLAEQTRIDVVDATSLPVDEAQATLTQFRKFSPPRPKTRKVFTIDSGLSVADRMSQMMSGGAGAAKKEGGELVEGTPEEAARHIVDFLVQNGLVQNGLAQNGLVQNGIVPGPGPS